MNDYIFIMNEQEQLVTILSNELPEACPYWEDLIKRQLTGLLTLDFYVPLNHPSAALLVNEGFVVVADEDHLGEFFYFRIKTLESSKATRSIKVFAENAAVTDLTGQNIDPITLKSNTIEQAMEIVLSNTGWQLGRVDYAGVQDFQFKDDTTASAAILQIVAQFGAEIKYRVNFDGSKVVGKYIDVVDRIGENTGKLFSYGYDLTDQVDRKIDTTDIVTALKGKGPADSNGNRMTFTNYNPVVPSGYEKQSNWIGNVAARERWGDKGKHLFSVYQDDTVQNQIDLYNKTKKKLDELSTPRYTYTVGVILLGPVGLGDDVQIQDESFTPPLLLNARVIETQKSKSDPSKNQVILGEYIPVLSSIPGIVKEAQTNIQKQIAAGAHVIADGPLFDEFRGGYYTDTDDYALKIAVTDPVHLDSCTIYCANDNTSGVVELRGPDDTPIETREYTNLAAGANVIKLNFNLDPEGSTEGQYRLAGSWDDEVFRYVDLVPESFPFQSGAFEVRGTTSSFGYWYWFFDLRIGGANVSGGYGSTLRAGNTDNTLGTMELLNESGETILVADNKQVSIGTLTAGQVISDSIVSYSAENFVYYVHGSMGNDENDGSISTPLASVQRALQLTPREIDGQVVIIIQSDITEDVTVQGFSGLGSITIYGGTRSGLARPFTYSHYTILGQVRIEACTVRVFLPYGKYFPSADTAVVANDAGTIQVFRSPYVVVQEAYIVGKVPGSSPAQYNHNALVSYEGSHVFLASCHIQNWGAGYAVRAVHDSSVVMRACTGNSDTTNSSVMNATYNGRIGVEYGASIFSDLMNIATTNGGHPTKGATGGVISNATVGGLIQGTTTGLSTTGTAGTNTSAPSTLIRTSPHSSSDGQTYRYTKTVGWLNDGTVRGGDNGAGENKGLWFFSDIGSSPPWVGKTITQIWLEVTRSNEGGGAGTITFTTHNYLTKPSGEPVVGTAYVEADFTFGEKKWVRLDVNPDIKAAFAANSAKGIALVYGDYSICSWEATLKVIYQE